MVKTAKLIKTKISKLTDLRPHPDNPKVHPDWQVEKLGARIISKEKYNQQIVTDESGLILKGVGRWLALKDRGYDQVEHGVIDGLTEEEKLAVIIADNKIISTIWDTGKLIDKLPKLHNIGLDTGFNEKEVKQMLMNMKTPMLQEQEQTYDMSPRLYESYNYILLFFKNDIDFLYASQMIGLKKMADRKKPDKVGVYRAVDGISAIKKIQGKKE